MHAEPQKQHQWLKKFIGQWTSEANCSMGPDKPAAKTKGTETVRALGDLWVLCEGQGEMPGGCIANMLLTLGYDPQKQRFVGSWVGSMMTHLWVYEGELDAAEKVLTLNVEGPDCTNPGKTTRYQDIIEFKSDDHRTLTSRAVGPDGQWHQFMEAHYRRVK